eukprot:2118613-Rhodomonas_salina.3
MIIRGKKRAVTAPQTNSIVASGSTLWEATCCTARAPSPRATPQPPPAPPRPAPPPARPRSSALCATTA